MTNMKHAIIKQGSWAITFDADLVETPGVEYFSVDYWRARQALSGEAVGRGSAWFIQAPFGPVVLRRFLRGGWAAVLSRESYFYTGVSASRSFREYHLLAELHAAGPGTKSRVVQHRQPLPCASRRSRLPVRGFGTIPAARARACRDSLIPP